MAYVDKLENIIVVAGGLVHAAAIVDGWNGYKVISNGVVVLNADVAFSATGTLYDDATYRYYYNAQLDTLSNNAHVSFHGVELPQDQTQNRYIVTAVYDLGSTSWIVTFTPDFEETDIVSTTNLQDKSVTLAKMDDLANAKVILGSSSNRPTAITPSGDWTMNNTGVTVISNDAITNAKINTNAAISISKLAAGTNGQLPITNAGVPTWTTLSGDVTMDASGVTTMNPSTYHDLWTPGVGSESILQVNSSIANTATGVNGISAGLGSNAAGDQSIAVGFECEADEQGSVAMGIQTKATRTNATAFGNLTTANAPAATALGDLSRANRFSQLSLASSNKAGTYPTDSYTQESLLSQGTVTTDGTSTMLSYDGTAVFSVEIPTNAILAFECMITAFQRGGSSGTVGDAAMWQVTGLIKNVSGTVAFVDTRIFIDNTGAASTTTVQRAADTGATAWTLGVVADNTNKSLNFVATGAVNKTIVWNSSMVINEIKYT